MAESILFDIATEVLTKIGSLVGWEVSLLWNLESDLKSLEGTLSTIKAVLSDAEKKQAQNDQLRDWLGKLKDVFLDAEDVLEEFELQASGREVERQKRSTLRKVCQCFSSSNPVGFQYEISHKIKEIRERLDQIASDRNRFSLIESTPVEVRHVIPKGRETDPFLGVGCKSLLSLCEGMQGLKSLRKLFLTRNPVISSLPNTIKYLKKLETLAIGSCPKINLKMELLEEDRELRLSLKKFIIVNLESLVDMPQLLLQASTDTLKYMQIEDCEKLEALPESLQNLTSLEKLEITRCYELSSLPEGIEHLTSLKELKITECPALIESYINDELKIIHVPVVHLIDHDTSFYG
ncbi:hypothetical protein Pint_17060 [Pistacia integerrima]|uniref:Uncharacterized protein n=1 Tax=Pistacia integerrima TaxID=434235 RepID=A0ACC0ZER4_9ROSI|nr:hypothetical protein Pint_17060 [Pistacia integerrima]